MKFSQEDPTDAQLVKSYDDQAIVIQMAATSELTTLTSAFILTADVIDSDPQLNAIASLTGDDIAYFESRGIEIAIFGQSDITRISPDVFVQFSSQAIGLEQMPIGAACRTYNLLVSEGRRAALYINF